MKAIWSGFWRGFVSASLIFGGVGIFVGAIWLLTVLGEWMIGACGELAAVIMLVGLTIFGAGAFQGLWVYKHYRRYKQQIRELEIESLEDPDPSCDYDYEISCIKNRIKELLSGDYSRVCR